MVSAAECGQFANVTNIHDSNPFSFKFTSALTGILLVGTNRVSNWDTLSLQLVDMESSPSPIVISEQNNYKMNKLLVPVAVLIIEVFNSNLVS